MKNKKTTIKQVCPCGAHELFNADASEVGLSSIAKNLRERESSLEVVGTPSVCGELQSGEEVVCTHGGRVITLLAGVLRHAGVAFATLSGTFCCAVPSGDFLVVLTTMGRAYYRWDGVQYTSLVPGDALPLLHLSAVESSTFTTPIGDYEFQNGGYSRWQVPLNGGDLLALSSMVRTAVLRARGEAQSSGRVCGLQLVCYALRLFDDSYLWVSPPVLVGHDVVLRNHYRSEAEVTTSSSHFTGIESVDAEVPSYRLGISVLRGIGSSWQGIVKAVDVLSAPVADVLSLSSSLDYRCGISTVGGERRYVLELGLKPRERSAVASQLLGGLRWSLVATTSRTDRLDSGEFHAANVSLSSQSVLSGHRCYAVTSPLSGETAITPKQYDSLLKSVSHILCGGCAIGHNGRVYHAPGSIQIGPQWDISNYFRGVSDDTPCEATMCVSIATANGISHIVERLTVPFVPARLNPLLSYPDPRATQLTLQIGERSLSVALSTVSGSEMSCALNPSLADYNTAAGTAELPTHTGCRLDAQGSLSASKIGNPFVEEWESSVCGASVHSLAIATRPIYSGGFGRYPLYLFTTQGIFALPQSLSGSYGEPRLIERRLVKSGVACVAGGSGDVWFIDQHGALCRLSGAKVRQELRNAVEVTHLAWSSREQELWLRLVGDRSVVVMPSGRLSERSVALASLYGDAGHAFGVERGGRLLDLDHEDDTSAQTVEYLSHPFVLEGKPTELLWDIEGVVSPATLELLGERGHSCHGFLINRLTLRGTVAAPIRVRLVPQPARTARLRIAGTMPSRSLLRAASLTVVS